MMTAGVVWNVRELISSDNISDVSSNSSGSLDCASGNLDCASSRPDPEWLASVALDHRRHVAIGIGRPPLVNHHHFDPLLHARST